MNKHVGSLNLPDEANVALSCAELHVSLSDQALLKNVSVSFPKGQWTAVVGPNGAGKSTLLRCLAGLAHQSSGQVQLLGRPLTEWSRKERARTLSWLGQGEAPSADLRCYDVVMLGRLPHQAWLSGPSADDHQIVEQVLRGVHAWQWRDRTLKEISGGERQRVLLARALAVQANVVLMDEPLANLDPPHQADWMDSMRASTQAGTTVVSVLHELAIALQADYMVVMQSGAVVHTGPTQDAATHAALESVFSHRIKVREVEGIWMALPVARP